MSQVEPLARVPLRGPRRLLLLLPALLLLTLHLPALDYGFAWVDEDEIVTGTLLRPPSEIMHALVEPMNRWMPGGGAVQPYYRPVQAIVASLVQALAGKSPRAFRSVSFALGALTVTLFTALVWWLVGRPGPALAAGLLVAAHPTGLETFVWIAGLSEALADLFIVTSLLALAVLAASKRRGMQLVAGAVVVAACLVAVLSKENGAVAPLLGFGMLASLAAGGAGAAPAELGAAQWRQLARRLGPILALQTLAAVLVLGPWRQHVLGALTGAVGWIGDDPVLQWRTAVALWPRAFLWLIAPVSSTTSDTVSFVNSWFEPALLVGALLALASAGACVLLLRRGHGVAAFGLFWIWAAYLPTAGLVPSVHMRAERYLHFPLFGLALLLATFLAASLRGRAARASAAAAALVALLVAGLAERTLERQPDWRSSRTLFESDLGREPGYREGRLQLALTQLRAGDVEQSWRTLRPLAENPLGDPTTTGYFGEANLAGLSCQLAAERGRFDEALLQLERLAERLPGAIDSPALRWCRARALAGVGQPGAAAVEYEALLASLGGAAPPELRLVLAWTLLAAGRPDAAASRLAELPPEVARSPQLAPELQRLRRALATAQPK